MAKILVVDDDKHIAAVLQELLSFDGHDVQVVDNASGALIWIKQESFDLILTDILMPVTDGIELIQMIRQLSNIPIIAMSGGRRTSTPANTAINQSVANLKLSNAITVGANATLTKPFIRAQLQQTISAVLNFGDSRHA
jgi:CheY-like chemotaxis protein